MNRQSFYKALITIIGVIVLAGGGLAQGKHGGGDKHGGGGGGDRGDHGRGQEMRQQQRGNDDHGNRGNGNAWGRQRGGNDERGGRQQQWQQQREQTRGQQQYQQQVYRQQQQYQQQIYRQQLQQQQIYRQQIEASRPQYRVEDRTRGRGNHNGWNGDGPRGNAYGLRNIWPGQVRGWRDADKQDRRDYRRNQPSRNYYYSDPLSRYYPTYQQPIYGYNNYSYNQRSDATRETVVRTIISTFFAPEPAYYNNNYYAPAYQAYSPVYYQPQYYGSGYGQPYYSQASYLPSYGSPYYGPGYDQYGGSPLFGSQLDSGLNGSILNIGLSLMRGLLGQGYEEGLDQGQCARNTYGVRSSNYYDPYAAAEPAYYSPLVSSFADQRQLLEEGYRLGYQDAMRNRDPYGTSFGGGRVDLLSEFLASTLSPV